MPQTIDDETDETREGHPEEFEHAWFRALV